MPIQYKKDEEMYGVTTSMMTHCRTTHNRRLMVANISPCCAKAVLPSFTRAGPTWPHKSLALTIPRLTFTHPLPCLARMLQNQKAHEP